ncbi:MAG: DUF4105 domain-containing protein [Prevotellaceae bacterium]|jgi:hypothetical protein|nr:DUF4105 domain-containing protein [Prevotellaceae bacterium]
MKKIKRLSLTAVFFCLSVASQAQYPEASDSTKVSLLTCSPGKEAYARFGHTAIRVYDAQKNIDLTFNYGIFDFNTTNFYLKFIKGETDYILGVTYMDNFLAEYIERNSSVREQTLNLSRSEKQKLVDALFANYEPENRVYRYNFVFDNCATRPRDKIKACLDSLLQYSNLYSEQTFRNQIEKYTGTGTWLKFGIDIVIGSQADVDASREASMFLPEALMWEFDNAYTVDSIGNRRQLVAANNEIVQQKTEETQASPWYATPMACSCYFLLLTCFVSYLDAKRQKNVNAFDSAILLITGLLGFVVVYLSFFSLHPLVKYNYNILWLNPLNVITAVIILIRPLKKTAIALQTVNFILLILFLCFFATGKQGFNGAFFPLAAALLIRCTVWLANELKVIKKNRPSKK